MKGRDWFHVLGGFVLQVLFMVNLHGLIALALVGAIGWGFELLQKFNSMFVPKGTYDIWDVGRTMIGGILGYIFVAMVPGVLDILSNQYIIDMFK